ncbi:dynamin family protein [Pleionea litopenaei]|uniref:Dynamin family protein n=1 Tax=Pleionea litopenaei TaxID=3070815 RepID=A0AA51RQX2_9GAMM|nr:dynamin family protein [Pleionea sp. HL-JVS1]WMS85895.1 dynamin family protein [Pleionea sp. HL-JVS1]
MADNQFTQSVNEFERWKSVIAKEMKGFRLWLRRNQLSDEQSDKRIRAMLETLDSEYLTIAFAGEFSRGKTELINAIFFSDYGQRILPSQAGRTTMCPTELFFDAQQQKNYLRLLPIETRLQDTSLTDYRDMPNHWVEIPLVTNEAEEMAQAMQSITQTKSVSRAEALELGFDATMLDEDEFNPEKVEIPAWRHAMVSFSHPLLQQGLRIVDTPGLNALGSEPELTYQLLPQAQAVVFVLAADAGVTASDLQIWEDHIEQLKNRPNLGLYAVLNKIDVLWDEISGRKKTEKAINRVIRQTSRHLKIPETDILPVSAQKALLGRIRDDKALLLRSQIDDVEAVLSETILGNKEAVMWDNVIAESTRLIEDAQQVLKSRKEQIEKQQDEIKGIRGNNESQLQDLVDKSRDAQAEFKKRHLALKPSQRLLERQADVLINAVGKEHFDEIIQRTLHEMVESKTSVGMMRTSRRFFQAVEGMMNEFCREAELTNKMAESMYAKFSRDFEVELLEARYLKGKIYRRQLQQILDESSQLNRNLMLTLTEQSVAVKRFFATSVNHIAMFFKKLRVDVRQWSREVMLPLIQQVNSLKETLDSNHQQLLALQHNEATVEGRLKALKTLVFELDTEIHNAQQSLEKLRQSAPKKSSSNVVELATARR